MSWACTLIEGFAASRSAAGAASVAVECMQATEASKLVLWKAIMVGLQPILLDRLQWKLLLQVGEAASSASVVQGTNAKQKDCCRQELL